MYKIFETDNFTMAIQSATWWRHWMYLTNMMGLIIEYFFFHLPVIVPRKPTLIVPLALSIN